MKRIMTPSRISSFKLFVVSFFAVLLISWGSVGHRTIGLIAERHLTNNARVQIQDLLGSSSLSEVSNWADEVRRDPEYRNTAPWHYINLPEGLSKQEFINEVTKQSGENVYTAVTKMEQQLQDPASSQEEKVNALKFIVHFVGDMHQPMHISRAEDQGGNKIQLNYEGKGTNLHALWDSKLIESESLSEQQLADKIDKATPAQIKLWQSDPMIEWMWESYQISSSLYSEVDQMSKRSVDERYYNGHISVLEDRLEKAGVRLAGLLNQIFPAPIVVKEKTKIKVQGETTNKSSFNQIALGEVTRHMNEEVRVEGRVFGEKDFSNMILLDVGASYPNQLLTIVLKGEAKDSWKHQSGSSLWFQGKVIDYRGKPEIIIDRDTDISSR